MNWASAAEFFAMGGYGAYVWGSYAVTALCLIVEPLVVRARRRAATARVKELDSTARRSAGEATA
jgi:heme exporter protein D